ncbi:hypothetical protein L21_0003 [Methanoculleus chikugoensis]|uniref:Uncharacterized protein n=1 Tax=Methanoculleus chikugoensis TaxID=118126 RepID=A0A1M4MGU5_9EURY|nr:hypothetical protein [Methanoculleus chikugoensis]SCL74139.1 hypothetical protein L21_0003 [Methanoculleus chikugoensis]
MAWNKEASVEIPICGWLNHRVVSFILSKIVETSEKFRQVGTELMVNLLTGKVRVPEGVAE